MKPYITPFAKTQADPSGFLADYETYQNQLKTEKEENIMLSKGNKASPVQGNSGSSSPTLAAPARPKSASYLHRPRGMYAEAFDGAPERKAEKPRIDDGYRSPQFGRRVRLDDVPTWNTVVEIRDEQGLQSPTPFNSPRIPVVGVPTFEGILAATEARDVNPEADPPQPGHA